MRRTLYTPWICALMLLVMCSPLLTGCYESSKASALVTSATPLPQAVEAFMADLPGPSPKLFLTTRVYDRQGVLLTEFFDEGRRYWVPLPKVAPAVRQATVATEDKSFFTNPGVDWSAIARAVVQNSGEGSLVSGASTITQQLARNIAMPYQRRMEQSLDRKFSETMLAQEITARFTKDQILEMYLNVVYYGHNAYGIEAAARTYFAKPASDLTLAEGALLSALPQAPAYLDPMVKDNLAQTKERQGLVLALMARNGFISAQEAEAAYDQPLQFKAEKPPAVVAPHFVQYVREYLSAQYGADFVNRGGLNVVTTLDLRMQNRAEQIVRQQVAAVRSKYNLSNGALVALKPGSGEILVMVGSANFGDASINGQVNVANSLRQPGSAIKPVLYSLAFTRGLVPSDLIWDTPQSFRLGNGRLYSPVNYDGAYHGAVRLRQALANSYNVPAIKLLNQVGVPAMLDMARAFGITSFNKPPETYGLALTLGGSEVSLLELTGVFATLANGGIRVPTTPIFRLTDSSGYAVQQIGQAPQAVVDPRVAYMVSSVLSDNAARTPMFGANSPLKLSRPAAAKTGTTTDWRDNWTLGYTPSLAVGVWAGNANGQPMRNTTGLTGAAPIWHDFMEAVFADPALDRVVRAPDEPLDFRRPPGLLDLPICDLTALRGNGPACTGERTDLFTDPNQPIKLGLAPAGAATGQPGAAPAAGTAVTITLSSTRAVEPVVTLVQGLLYAPGKVCVLGAGGKPMSVVRLPADPAQRSAAEAWAAKQKLPVDQGPCTRELLGGTPPVQAKAEAAVVPATGQIVSPAAGSLVAGPVTIFGSATFSKPDVQFYKVEYATAGNPERWTTMGAVHANPVANGALENWYADSLPDGSYLLRVVLVKRDGNFVASAPVMVQLQN